MSEKSAIEHITDRGISGSTNQFNIFWAAVTALVTTYLGVAEGELTKVQIVMLPAVIGFIPVLANTILYGVTWVKHAKNRKSLDG